MVPYVNIFFPLSEKAVAASSLNKNIFPYRAIVDEICLVNRI